MNGNEEAATLAAVGAANTFKLWDPPPSTPDVWVLITIDNGTTDRVRFVVRRRRFLPGYRARWERVAKS